MLVDTRTVPIDEAERTQDTHNGRQPPLGQAAKIAAATIASRCVTPGKQPDGRLPELCRAYLRDFG